MDDIQTDTGEAVQPVRSDCCSDNCCLVFFARIQCTVDWEFFAGKLFRQLNLCVVLFLSL